MSERRRQRARAALEEARRLLDGGDARGAVEPLERARADFAAELDLDSVREVRAEAERGYGTATEADEPFYEQLLYASGQNVRFLTRREATRRGVAWADPHPELDQPGRPEIRIERGLSRRAKRWIAGVALALVAAAAAVAAGVALSIDHATLVNDTSRTVEVTGCGGGVAGGEALAPGERRRFTGWGLCVALRSGDRILGCVHLHDHEVARVSDAERCE
jgi:hypothetical protein